jgi:hypothetical protein
MRNTLAVAFYFAVKMVVGAFLFTIVAVIGAGLNEFTNFLDSRGYDRPLIWGLVVAEYTLVIADIAVFIAFICVTAWKTWKDLRQ